MAASDSFARIGTTNRKRGACCVGQIVSDSDSVSAEKTVDCFWNFHFFLWFIYFFLCLKYLQEFLKIKKNGYISISERSLASFSTSQFFFCRELSSQMGKYYPKMLCNEWRHKFRARTKYSANWCVRSRVRESLAKRLL